MSELKNCPFCGKAGEPDEKAWYGESKEGVKRHGPGCNTCGSTGDTFESWNTRPIEDILTKKVETLRGALAKLKTGVSNCHSHVELLRLIKEAQEATNGDI